MMAKRDHVAAVLQMQSLKTSSDEEGIALVSRMISEVMRKQSFRVVVGYLKV